MWYNVDFNRWVVQLLPPILRSKFLTVLLKTMLLPVVWLHGQFMIYRATVAGRLNVTACVQDIERILNVTFFLTQRQIYIEETNNVQATCLYFGNEKMPDVLVNSSLTVWYPDEVPDTTNIIVYVPGFLCTSLDKEKDRHKGRHLSIIINLIEYYKPAGRRYGIRLYDNE